MAKICIILKITSKNYTKFHKSQMAYLDIIISKYTDKALSNERSKISYRPSKSTKTTGRQSIPNIVNSSVCS